jgi:hypothetical protein
MFAPTENAYRSKIANDDILIVFDTDEKNLLNVRNSERQLVNLTYRTNQTHRQ